MIGKSTRFVISGKFANTSASLSCDNCDAGSFAASTNQTLCSICPRGQYSSSGKTFCDECETGKNRSPTLIQLYVYF